MTAQAGNVAVTAVGEIAGNLTAAQHISAASLDSIRGDVTAAAPQLQVTGPGGMTIWQCGWFDFGSTAIGEPLQFTFTLLNQGTAELLLDGNSVSIAEPFSVVSPFDQTVPPGQSTSFTVQLDAEVAGSYETWLSFSHNDILYSPFHFYITGQVTDQNGNPPDGDPTAGLIHVYDESWNEITPDSGTIDFGTTAVGVPRTHTFTLLNWSDEAAGLDPNSLTVPAGFQVVQAFDTTVDSYGETSLTVQLDSPVAGSYGGTLTFATVDPQHPLFEIPIAGQVIEDSTVDGLSVASIGLYHDTGPLASWTAAMPGSSSTTAATRSCRGTSR